jgi:NAD(P)H-dependent flavin oxidoreductase YrpB (nitropropane dioxygenase family)
MKMSPDIETMSADELRRYATVCGWALARAHARAGGSAAAIAGYLGRSDAFDEAIAVFSRAYADRNELDYRALQKARDEGRIVAKESV